MGVFGPGYPARLQVLVSHAERFCQLLSRAQERAGVAEGRTLAWLSGRASEIELVLALSVGDWVEERVSMDRAATAFAEYLGELHAAARRRLGLEGELDCCCDEVFLTEVVGSDAETRNWAPGARPATPTAHDTWFDPGAVLLELGGESARLLRVDVRRLAPGS